MGEGVEEGQGKEGKGRGGTVVVCSNIKPILSAACAVVAARFQVVQRLACGCWGCEGGEGKEDEVED